jgi:transcription antitermination factor NusG
MVRAMFEPSSYWGVARVQGQRESFAAEQLKARGFETFLPKIETSRTVEPLFKGYVFLLIVGGHWLAANTTFGVISLIKAGDCPSRVPDAEIAAIRARVDGRGIIILPPEPPKRVYKRGDRVKVVAFGSTFSAIHSGMTSKQREIVLMQVLGSVREIAVARHLVSAQ